MPTLSMALFIAAGVLGLVGLAILGFVAVDRIFGGAFVTHPVAPEPVQIRAIPGSGTLGARHEAPRTSNEDLIAGQPTSDVKLESSTAVPQNDLGRVLKREPPPTS